MARQQQEHRLFYGGSAVEPPFIDRNSESSENVAYVGLLETRAEAIYGKQDKHHGSLVAGQQPWHGKGSFHRSINLYAAQPKFG